MEEKDKELIPPDYYGHPEDDDPLEEIIETDDEDARIKKFSMMKQLINKHGNKKERRNP